MARTLSTIYNSIKSKCSEYRELDEVANSSKFSLSNTIFYIVSSAIYTFEVLMDTFQVDLAKEINKHVNGTLAYYQYMLKKYQSGDRLVVSDDFINFQYAEENVEKQIVKGAKIDEVTDPGYNDKRLEVQVATESDGVLCKIGEDELVNISSYMNQIAFAGTRFNITSRSGDVLIPKMTVYYDGKITPEDMWAAVEETLKEFCVSTSFTGRFYIQRIVDALLNVEHVMDIHCDITDDDNMSSGIFFATYDEDDQIVLNEYGKPKIAKAERSVVPVSGYIVPPKADGSDSLPAWKETIKLSIEI